MADEPTTPQQPAPPPADPWSAFSAAGLTPDQLPSPVELSQNLQYLNALADPQTRPQALEESLRHWQMLPEGVSLEDTLRMAQSLAEQNQNPWAQGQPQPGQPEPQPGFAQQQPYPGGYQDPNTWQPQAPQAPAGPTPEQIDAYIQQRAASIVDQRLSAFQAEQQKQSVVGSLRTQLDNLARENGLDESAKGLLWDNVAARLHASEQPGGQPIAPDALQGLVAGEFQRQRDMWQAHFGAMAAQRQQRYPAGQPAPPSMAPGEPAPTGIQGAIQAEMARIAAGGQP